jgi:heat shock protein HslJ
MRTFITIITSLFLATFILSCEGTSQVLNTGSRVELTGSYNVITVNGLDMRGTSQTIVFNGLGKTISGNAGCNTYNASFDVNNLVLTIGDVATTRKTCPDIEKERQFLAALDKVNSYTKSEGKLQLLDNSNNIVMTATAQSN